jgi:uncharacterized protein
LGFGQVRVRHDGDVARIEVPEEDFAGIMAVRREVVEAMSSAGYAFATLDLEGFRSGKLNRVLDASSSSGSPRP